MNYKLLIFLGIALFANTCLMAQETYEKAWEKIDSLVNKQGLTGSALQEVNTLYDRAKKEQQEAQLIKALIYMIPLQEQLQEDAWEANIDRLKQEIATAPLPARAIMQSILAETYWRYLQQNRSRLYNRTNTTGNYQQSDIATWSMQNLQESISNYYLSSIAHENILQQTSLESYEAILHKGNTRSLRPTLYDLLAHRALDYFKNDERSLNQPAYTFEIDQPQAFAPAAAFSHYVFNTADSTSTHVKALHIYQQLLQFHAKDPQPDALVDADIERLTFVHMYSVLDNKDSLYLQALKNITHQYDTLPTAAQAWYLQAGWYAGQARQYNAQDTSHRYDYLPAIAICRKVLQQKTPSEGRANCQNLLNEINQPSVQLTTEEVNVPHTPFRTLVSFRNFTTLYLRIIPINDTILDSLGQRWENGYWEKLAALPALHQFSQAFPDTKDYQQHHAEIKTDGLPPGDYALLACTDANFESNHHAMNVQMFKVTDIAFIKNGDELYIVSRETGHPLPGASVQVFNRIYNSQKGDYELQKGHRWETDQKGYVKIPAADKKENASLILEITYKNDRYRQGGSLYIGRTLPASKVNNSAYLFTDRSIYRPGQTVYFKGLLVQDQTDSSAAAILSNQSSTIYLYDANYQAIDSIQLTTNEFGTYNGRFTLPTGSLNGQFSLRDKFTENRISFSVEEYKRPQFEVSLPQPTGTHRLNDSITVTGNAKAYAGNTVNDATVQYRVVRKTIIPLAFYQYRSFYWPRQPETTELVHGTTTTAADGSFEISFKAIPDLSTSKKLNPSFYYEISADVTALNGETRSGTVELHMGWEAIQLEIAADGEPMPADSVSRIRINSTNYTNEFEKTAVTLRLQKLEAPDRIFRERYWQQPDQFVMSRDEYYQLFPYDVYKDEDNPATFPTSNLVWQTTDSTTVTGHFNIPGKKIQSGWYLLEASTIDRYGDTARAVQYLQVYNKNEETSTTSYVSITTTGEQNEPGQQASYTIRTNLDHPFLIHDIKRTHQPVERTFPDLKKGKKDYSLPIKETDRGGIALSLVSVQHNRFYRDMLTLPVAYTNKELSISYETFRDKTLPGSQETWKVKITGLQKEKVAAELLTTMYDASLDQFKKQQWSVPEIWKGISTGSSWSGEDFSYDEGMPNLLSPDWEIFNKQYDWLIYYSSPVFNKRTNSRQIMAPTVEVQNGLYSKDIHATAAVKFEAGTSDPISDDTETATTVASPAAIQLRKDFRETAFFFPTLHTDDSGSITFSFTMPEALTRWKWMLLAHTKDLAMAYSEKNIVTQKELMVQPNAPRFLREGDRMDFSTSVVNLSDKEITGQVQLLMINATTGESVDGWFRNMFPNQYFTAAPGQSIPVKFTLEIPYQYNQPVTYRVIARSGEVSDGEEGILPVVSNRILVTESLPLAVKGNGIKKFELNKLLNSENSPTLSNQALTVEFTANPSWLAVQSLPWLAQPEYACSEQYFNSYYANALAAAIAQRSPGLQAIVEKWKTTDTTALASPLQKNETLKNLLLQETPWVLDAQNETQQKQNIAQLFDSAMLQQQLQKTLEQLSSLQSEAGGFVWFKNGPDNRYMTQYILTGLGHLKKLQALPAGNATLDQLISKGVAYLDEQLKADYESLEKSEAALDKQQIGMLQIQYLYMRSFFKDIPVPGGVFKAYNYYRKQSQQFWLSQNRYMQGMIALSLFRTGEIKVAGDIVRSLKEKAIVNETTGMYWKTNTGGYYWYQAPIETQALLTEVFAEIGKDDKAVAGLKTWLLTQKQTQRWQSSKATADACYALLLQGSNWTAQTPAVKITVGNKTLSPANTEAGTGYFKETIPGSKVTPDMGTITVDLQGNNAAQPAWGAVYWQYLEDMDNITTATNSLQVSKKLFIERHTDSGPVLEPIGEHDEIKVGDKIKVRVVLTTDRDLEFVHLKDMRAACMEPVNVLSGYRWQGGLGYYESTRDASTDFFFDRLPKGTWVFEYPLFVTLTGTYSNGITTAQCMYAPEFTSHSEGIKVNVEK